MTKIILGIDPGLNKTGWGIISTEGSKLSYINSGAVKTNPTQELPDRISHIYSELHSIASQYNPDCCAIEETFVNKNPLSSLKLGYARSAAILSAANLNIPIFEYSAKYVKKAVVGLGKADKQQIAFMIKTLFPKITLTSEDEADALAVAVSHANSNKYETKNY